MSKALKKQFIHDSINYNFFLRCQIRSFLLRVYFARRITHRTCVTYVFSFIPSIITYDFLFQKVSLFLSIYQTVQISLISIILVLVSYNTYVIYSTWHIRRICISIWKKGNIKLFKTVTDCYCVTVTDPLSELKTHYLLVSQKIKKKNIIS